MKPGMTSYEQVSRLASGITSGYEDGTFKPNNKLTRAHGSLFLVRAMNLNPLADIQKNKCLNLLNQTLK